MVILSFTIGFLTSYYAAIMQEGEIKRKTEDVQLMDIDTLDSLGTQGGDYTSYVAPTTTLELIGRIAWQQNHVKDKLAKEYR